MLNDTLHVLLGAALVAIGVLATALADRIRGLQASRRERAMTPATRGTVRAARPPIDVVDAEVVEAAPPPRCAPTGPTEPRPARTPRAEVKLPCDGADDVIAALVAAGYKKPIATEATWACGQGERASIEGWTRAALRRCVRGGMS